MVDILSAKQRSINMAAIRGRDTQPELIVRRVLSVLGIRYRLHVQTLPGRPDIVMQGRRKVIEVRGCFWHRHRGCKFAYMPKSRVKFWKRKFDRNVERDIYNAAQLRRLGYKLLIVWECHTVNLTALRLRL